MIKSLIAVILIIFLSHVALPFIGYRDIGPLFTWNLFSETNKESYFDILVYDRGEVKMLSLQHRRHKKSGQKFAAIRRLLIDINRKKNVGPNKQVLNSILSNLGYKDYDICKIDVELNRYILMDEDERAHNCHI